MWSWSLPFIFMSAFVTVCFKMCAALVLIFFSLPSFAIHLEIVSVPLQAYSRLNSHLKLISPSVVSNEDMFTNRYWSTDKWIDCGIGVPKKIKKLMMMTIMKSITKSYIRLVRRAKSGFSKLSVLPSLQNPETCR